MNFTVVCTNTDPGPPPIFHVPIQPIQPCPISLDHNHSLPPLTQKNNLLQNKALVLENPQKNPNKQKKTTTSCQVQGLEMQPWLCLVPSKLLSAKQQSLQSCQK